ncbi:MAG: glycosyltransferase family 9 protein [candidate division Zixibacteria bacterium]|nr:glycosyltransferase family 9 protein [candidate division Zixibacteria bacterium]
MLIKKYITALVKFIIHLGGTIFVKPFLLVARYRAMKRIPENPKILYVSLAFRGDLVLTFPALRALRKRFPKSSITLWVREYNVPLTDLCPDIDKVESYDKFNLHGLGALLEYFPKNVHQGFINKIRRAGYDIYIDDSGYTFSALVGSLSNIPIRIGRNQQGFGFLYHYDFPYDYNRHLVKKKFTLLEPFGISILNESDILPKFNISNELVTRTLSKYELSNIRYFTCFPCAGWTAKNWQLDRFVSVVNEFSFYSNLTPVFLGGEKDKIIIDYIKDNVKSNYHILIGNTSIIESAAVVSRAEIHFGVDSVGTHLAAASNIRSLTLFGPTNPRLIAYLSDINIALRKKISCAPKPDKIYCRKNAGRSCSHISCMRELKKEDVLAVLIDLWDGKIKSKVIEV